MTPIDMMRIVCSDMERIAALIDSGPRGYVLHTADYTRFLCHNDNSTTVARLEEPADAELYVLRTPRAARTMQNYWNSMQTDEWKRVTISLREEALRRHLEGHLMLVDALCEYQINATKGAIQ